MPHAIIIGGTRGLGRVVAQQFSARGDRVSVIGRNAPKDSDRELANTHYYSADLLQQNQIDQALSQIQSDSGAPNYLVFCQRYRGQDNPWEGEIAVSLTATRRIIEALAPSFVPESDNGIVMVSSVFGEFVGQGQPVSYHMAKAAMNQMARFYAVELGQSGIRSNAVTTFTFLKEESKNFYLGNEALLNLYQNITPAGRMGSTEDVANVISFLCTPASRFVNGQNIYVDGGLSLVWPESLARRQAGV